MSLPTTYNLVAGILLLTRVGFIAVPNWSRWMRNLMLVRKGIKTKGRYKGDNQVAFQLDTDRRVTFWTWQLIVKPYYIGDELPVLYDPTNPYIAEVMTHQALWNEPLSNLTMAAMWILATVLLCLDMNIALALIIAIVIGPCIYYLSRFALYHLYPPSRLEQFNTEKIEQKTEQKNEDLPAPIKQAKLPISTVKRRAAREQLLHDMACGSDTLSTSPLHEEES